jgi:hypothetical protein
VCRVESLLIFTSLTTPVASSADGILNMVPVAAVNHAAALDAGGRVSLLTTSMNERQESRLQSHQRKSQARDLLLSKKLAVLEKARKEIGNDLDLQIQLVFKLEKEAADVKNEQLTSEELRLISVEEAKEELELNQLKEEEDEEHYRLLEFKCIHFNMTDEERGAILKAFDQVRASRRSVLPRRVSFP